MAKDLPGVELGTYYVSVTTSTSKLRRDLAAASGTAADQAGKTAGEAYANAYVKRANPIIANALKLVPAAIGGAVAFKGIDRLLNIDAAEAKLRGLGSTTTDVTSIMDSALKSVQGTAYGLGDAATIAASAVAAGVQQGSDLTNYLKLVADTASITGDDLASVGATLNNVQTVGAAYNDSLQILAQKGLPVYDLLADKLGISTAAVKELASEGKISADTLTDVLQNKIGGAALKAGTTIQGSFDNLGASLSRIGANLLSGGTEQLPKFFTDLTNALKPVEEVAKSLGAVVGTATSAFSAAPIPIIATAAALALVHHNSDGLKNLGGGISSAVTNFKSLAFDAELAGSKMPKLRVGLASVGSAAKTAGSSLLGAFGGPVGLGITAAIAAITFGLSAWQAATEKQKQAVADLTATLNENTGAVTAMTNSQVADDIKSTTDALREQGVDVTGLGAILAKGGKDWENYRANLVRAMNDADNGATHFANQSPKYRTLSNALKALDAEHGNLSSALQVSADKLNVLGKNTGSATKAVSALSYATDKAGDAITKAFSKAVNTGASVKAIDALKQSLSDTKTGFSNLTSGGIANTAALQDAVSALATQAGGNTSKLVGSVSGLLDSLRASGVDTTNVIGVVNAALKTITGNDWTVYLNGSQAIVEAKNIAKAALLAAQATYALQLAQQGDNLNAKTLGATRNRIASLKSEIKSLNSQLSSVHSVSAAYSSYTPTVTKAAKATKSAAAVTTSATKAQRAFAKALAAKIDDASILGRNGVVKAASAVTSEYNKFLGKIAAAYKKHKITKDERDDLIGSAKDWRDSANDARKAVSDVFSNVKDWLHPSSLSSDAQSLDDSILDAYSAGGISKSVRDSLIKSVSSADKKLSGISAQRDALATKIDSANQALSDAIAARDDFKKSIQDGYKNLADFGSLSQATQKTITTTQKVGNKLITTTATSSTRTASSYLSGLAGKLTQARNFKTAYEKLAKSGLNADSLKSLVSDFLSTGDASLAQSLVSSGAAAITQINSSVKELGKLGTGLGTEASNSLYQAGVDTAKGFLDGLQSKDKDLEKAYNQIADKLVATVKKKLGIHSPSKVMAQLAQYTSQGWNDNLQFDDVEPAVSVSSTDGSSSLSPVPSELVIYDTNGVLVGRMAVEALRVLNAAKHEERVRAAV